MANDSTGNRTSNHTKAPSRGSTPRTPNAPNSRPPPLPTSQPTTPKIQHVPSQPPATSAWASAARTATTVRTAPAAKVQPISGAGLGSSATTASSPSAPVGSAGHGVTPEHRPVNGYNAKEVKDFLKKVQETSNTGETKAATKTEASATPGKRSSGGAWGAKPSQMANGQDFWVQLTKQVAQLEQQGRGG